MSQRGPVDTVTHNCGPHSGDPIKGLHCMNLLATIPLHLTASQGDMAVRCLATSHPGCESRSSCSRLPCQVPASTPGRWLPWLTETAPSWPRDRMPRECPELWTSVRGVRWDQGGTAM